MLLPEKATFDVSEDDDMTAAIDLTSRVLVAIHMPAAWTAATLSFVASPVSGKSGERVRGIVADFDPVFDASGTELEVTVAANHVIAIPPDATRGMRFIKLCSGPSTARVAQLADRELVILTVEDNRT